MDAASVLEKSALASATKDGGVLLVVWLLALQTAQDTEIAIMANVCARLGTRESTVPLLDALTTVLFTANASTTLAFATRDSQDLIAPFAHAPMTAVVMVIATMAFATASRVGRVWSALCLVARTTATETDGATRESVVATLVSRDLTALTAAVHTDVPDTVFATATIPAFVTRGTQDLIAL